MRSRFARALRAVTVRRLEEKPSVQLAPTAAVLEELFSQGSDLVVSGHRHVLEPSRYTVDGRDCRHLELPPWCDEGILWLSREGTLMFGRY